MLQIAVVVVVSDRKFTAQYGNQSEISKFDVIFQDQKEVDGHTRLPMAKWSVCSASLSVGTIKFAFPNPNHHSMPNPNHHSMPVGRAYIANDRHCTNTSCSDRIACILHKSHYTLSVLTILPQFLLQDIYLIYAVPCTIIKMRVYCSGDMAGICSNLVNM